MRRISRFVFLCAFLVPLITAGLARAEEVKPFELLDGDRVALIGNTFIEREQTYSYLETFLRTRWPEREIIFRNLGWSGDTVAGQARGYEKDADAGFARLDATVHELKPTVLFISYGMGESFDGEAGLDTFRDGLKKMLEMLKDLEARTVLIGPIRHDAHGSPVRDPAEHNRHLKLYTQAMADIARERGHRFIDLYELLGEDTRASPSAPQSASPFAPPFAPLTENGIHLSAYGYWRVAGVIESALGLPPRGWDIVINGAINGVIDGTIDGTKVTRADGVERCEVAYDQQVWTLRVTPSTLPPPVPPGGATRQSVSGSERRITIAGLPQGEYVLSAEGKPVASGSHEAWANGVEIAGGPASRIVEQVRDLAIEKNIQYFNQWRPANEPYIFGFRKQEQSRNRVEIPRFDEPIERLEAEITRLSQPVAVIYELKPK